MMNQMKEELAEALIRINAFKFGKFRLKLHEQFPDAPLSPIYVDLRVIRSFPKVMSTAIALLRQQSEGLMYDAIADVPTAGTPFASVLSYILEVPMISPRLDTKGHGTGATIDGSFQENWRVLLIDDLITTADSKIAAINTLKSRQVRVNDVLVLLDREQGGMQELERHGYLGHSVFQLRPLLKYYLHSGLVSNQEATLALNYLNSAP